MYQIELTSVCFVSPKERIIHPKAHPTPPPSRSSHHKSSHVAIGLSCWSQSCNVSDIWDNYVCLEPAGNPMIPHDSNRVVVIIGFFSIGYLCSTFFLILTWLQLCWQAKCGLTSPTAGICEGWTYHSEIPLPRIEHQNPQGRLRVKKLYVYIPSRGIEGLFIGFSIPLD